LVYPAVGMDTMNLSSLKRLRKSLGRASGNRRGQALAEMAILLPVLLLLVFGIIEMSNAWRTFQVVTNSAREGARVAILSSADQADVTTRITTSMTTGGLDPARPGAQIIVQCVDLNGQTANRVCSGSGETVQIRIEYPFTFNVLGRLSGLVPITISSTSTMRHE
jgi:Flp pilus assembly protein TadG